MGDACHTEAQLPMPTRPPGSAGGSLLLRLARNLSEPWRMPHRFIKWEPFMAVGPPLAARKVGHMRRSISHYLGKALRLTAYRHSYNLRQLDACSVQSFFAPRFRHLASSDLCQEPHLEQPGRALGDLSPALHPSRSLPSSVSRKPRWEAGKAAKRKLAPAIPRQHRRPSSGPA